MQMHRQNTRVRGDQGEVLYLYSTFATRQASCLRSSFDLLCERNEASPSLVSAIVDKQGQGSQGLGQVMLAPVVIDGQIKQDGIDRTGINHHL